MDGILLYWRYTGEYWNTHFLQLLYSAEDSKFRKSFIRNGSKILYGDKDVSHRKMEGNVPPLVDHPVFDWDGEKSTQRDGMYRNYLGRRYRFTRSYYHSGVNYAQSVAYFMYGWGNGDIIDHHSVPGDEPEVCTAPSVRSARIVNNHGTLVLQVCQFTGEDQHYRNAYDATDTIYFSEPEDVVWNDWGWSYDEGSSWNLNPAYFSQRACSYEQLHPIPYYWLDHMADIKPSITPGLVSEVIRNTITEETTLATNSYANLTEVVDMINDFRKGKIIDLIEDTKDYYRLVKNTIGNISGKNLRTLLVRNSKEISSGWLKYRYAYSTTKSDIEQYVEVCLGKKMGRLKEDRVLRGKISDANYEVRVKMRLVDNTAPNFDYVLIGLNQYGLMPSLYNLWDMIPYSFIADWGSNLGDYLQDIDESTLYWRYYKIKELLVTEKCVKEIKEPWGITTYTWYDRSLLDDFPQWEIYVDDGASARVKVYRTLDAASLLIGSL